MFYSTMIDIDECQTNVCRHICINTKGSFYCECQPGKTLMPDKRSCIGE